MSVKIMSAIFETEFRDLTDAEGNVTKASTAKLVLLALADHANDEGESAYPSVERLSKKTALSEQTIRNTMDALKFNGVVFLQGSSKYRTNNYTINVLSFPRLSCPDDAPLRTPNRLEGQTDTVEGSNGSLLTPNRLDPNHPLTTTEPSVGGLTKEEVAEVNRKVDGYLDLSQSPGMKKMARVDAILSYLANTFRVNTETKRWKELAEYIDGRQQKGEKVDVFVSWLLRQKNFDIQYWPPHRMKEMWPQAFSQPSDNDKVELL